MSLLETPAEPKAKPAFREFPFVFFKKQLQLTHGVVLWIQAVSTDLG
jgi:hypothetical protein